MRRSPIVVGAGAAALVRWPWLTLPVAGLAIAKVGRSRWRSLRPGRSSADSVGQLCRLLLICSTGGLPLVTALEMAAGQLPAPLADHIHEVLRRARQVGLAEALSTSSPLLRPLGLQLARSVVSGAPLQGALAGYLDELRGRHRASALQRARRLPVLLVIPLALLILPGFVLITVGPSVVSAFGRLLGPLSVSP